MKHTKAAVHTYVLKVVLRERLGRVGEVREEVDGGAREGITKTQFTYIKGNSCSDL